MPVSVSETLYDMHIQDALREVQTGQHLRFINYYFLTKEVCLEALLYEICHNDRPYDIGSVPVANLDFVVERLKEETPTRSTLHEFLDRRRLERKERAQQPGYFDFYSLESLLEHHQVATWDDMLKKVYNTRNENNLKPL